MGIIVKQSLQNTLVTYLGFAIGAVNTLFLYTRFLSPEYFGLVGVILSTSVILMPLMVFGVPNTLVKFYSSYREEESRRSFLNLMLMLPLLLTIPLAIFAYFADSLIGDFLARRNEIVRGYQWYIFLIALAMAYFEVFFAWAKVHLKSVFGNLMKEVFVRVGVSVLLLLVYWDKLSPDGFLKALVGLYLLRTAVMKLYAYKQSMPDFKIRIPERFSEVFQYSSLIILGGSVAVILLEIDRFMINQFIPIENVAYYTVAIFIATVIAVPSRAMHQITYPLTAELMNASKMDELSELYKKSSLTLLIVAGLIFLLVILNLEQLYLLLPEAYRGGLIVVFFIGLCKVYDALLGNNNSILFNSDYYRWLLYMGFGLVVVTVFLNLWLIPEYGLNGAALATFLAISAYNTIKLVFVYRRFGLHPLTASSFKVFGLLLFTGLLFYALEFPFHPLLNICFKSGLISAMYIGILYRFKLSEDIIKLLNGWFRKV